MKRSSLDGECCFDVSEPPAGCPSNSCSCDDGSRSLFYAFPPIFHRSVLDFYVHESCQRQGVGRKLFEAMLAEESLRPHLLAYDCPSPKFLSFLRKHYGLASFIPQANNFVVFDSYFQPAGVPQAAPDQRLGRRASRQVDLDHRHPALARYELARELTHGAAGPRRSNVAHRTGDTIGEKARATLHAGADKHGDIGATREASPEPHAPAKVSGAFDGARTARWGGQDGDASTSRGPAPLPDSRAVEGRRPPLTGWEPRLGATGADAPGGRARRGTCDVGVSAATWGLGRTGGGHAGGGTTGRSGGGSAYRVRPPWGVWDDETVGAGEARGTMGGSGMGMVRGPDVGQWLHPGRLAAGGWTANGGRAGGRGAVGGVGA